MIRPLRPDDLDRAISEYEAVAAEGRWIGGEAPVDRPARKAKMQQTFFAEGATDRAWVAEVDGQIVGMISLHGSGRLDLGMFVASAHRGKGIGRALMDAAIAHARSSGAFKISLEVWPHNAAAIALYRKYGFVEEGRRVNQIRRQSGELWDIIDMGLLL